MLIWAERSAAQESPASALSDLLSTYWIPSRFALSFDRARDKVKLPSRFARSLSLACLLACLHGVWGVGLPPLPLRSRATPLSSVFAAGISLSLSLLLFPLLISLLAGCR